MDMKHTTLSLAMLTLALGTACGEDAKQPVAPQGPGGVDDRPAEEGDGEDTSGEDTDGEDTDGEDGTTVVPNPDSTLDAPWSSHCTATATRAFQAADTFGDPIYAVKEGEEFVLGDFSVFESLELIALTDAGPLSFNVEFEDGDMPLELSCDESETKTMIGVFADVTLYLDEALTQEACSLEAGTIAERGEGGFGYAGGGVSEDGSSTYQLSIAGLSTKCSGHSEVYARVPSVEVDGVWHDLIPVLNFQTLD